MLKNHIEELLLQALLHLKRDGVIPADLEVKPQLERARSAEHGDYATNLAMVLAKPASQAPRQLAQEIIDRLPRSRQVRETEIAGPGFVNFHLDHAALGGVVRDALDQKEAWGREQLPRNRRVNVEFVSANPTGPLHVGHGRGAAFGASLANILEAAGYQVHREYYVNDAGRQMDILAVCVWLRYLELCGERMGFPDNGYRGEYVYDIARIVRSAQGDQWRFGAYDVLEELPADGSDGGDAEAHVDALIGRANELLGKDGFAVFFNAALEHILGDIRADLADFGVTFDRWFSEAELERSGAIEHAIDRLRENGHLYVKGGAVWFRASALGDEKDRVVIRDNGRTTYFASDIAYFLNKLERGYDRALYVFGADHHGYVARLKAAARGLGEDPERLLILLVQFAVLYREGKKVQMSTRSGQFITLRELRDEVGSDAGRFFYVMRSPDQHLDFDLDLAKSKTNENPVYYVQYAHARICSVFRTLEEMDLQHNTAIGEAALNLLTEDRELALLRVICRYPEIIEAAARLQAPQQLAHYLTELATEFHGYYNAHQFIVDEENLRNARLNLIEATRITLGNGLTLLGISTPAEM